MTKEHDNIAVSALVVLMIVAWLAFAFHEDPRFPGSLWGGVLAVTGTALMLVPLAYMIIKRIKPLKKFVTKFVPMRQLLTWHIYAGVIGPILVLMHTGHKFRSPLGITLTAMTLIVVISGFVGRYLMSHISRKIKEKKSMLAKLNDDYEALSTEMATHPVEQKGIRPFSGFFGRLFASWFLPVEAVAGSSLPLQVRAVRVAESIADLEYAVRTHETFKKAFSRWLKTHIVISLILYVLIGLHVWASVHFGLRWFDSASFMRKGGSYSQWVADEKAPDKFQIHYSRVYQKYWRPEAIINDIPTTVFDYRRMSDEAKSADSDFGRAVAALRDVDPVDFDGDDREKAFWLNLYNFAAMKLVVDHYPIGSIRDRKVNLLGNPWSLDAIQLGDEWYSLTQIEKKILLKKFDDPRIVFGVSCAALSCPDRPPEIFQQNNLDAQLDSLVSELFRNSKKGLSLNEEEKSVRISWILKADRELFEKDGGVLGYVARYAPPEKREWLERHGDEASVEYFEHDWALNDTALADNVKRSG